MAQMRKSGFVKWIFFVLALLFFLAALILLFVNEKIANRF